MFYLDEKPIPLKNSWDSVKGLSHASLTGRRTSVSLAAATITLASVKVATSQEQVETCS